MSPWAIVASGLGGAVLASAGWIAAWWERGHTSDARDDARDEREHATDITRQLVVATSKARRLEVQLANTGHSDPIINRWFAAALDALPPAGAQLIRDGLRADQLHQAGDDPSAGGDTEPVPTATSAAPITELR